MMNRIQHPGKLRAAKEEIPADPVFSIESALFTPSSRDASRSLFAPLHYEPKYAYPLIVWLHGPGADERQLLRIMPVVSMRNYVAVAPRGLPLGSAAREASVLGWPQSPQDFQEAEQRIFDSIESVQGQYNIAEHRIFLAGFDSGGTVAFLAAMAHPSRFAGVLSIGGAFPSGHTPFRQLTEARRLPVFLAVGRDSQQYTPAAACEDLRLFHTAGMSITLRQYPCGHELTSLMLRDVDRWIIEQITAPAAPQPEPHDRLV